MELLRSIFKKISPLTWLLLNPHSGKLPCSQQLTQQNCQRQLKEATCRTWILFSHLMKVLPRLHAKRNHRYVPQSISIVMREKIEIFLHFSPLSLASTDMTMNSTHRDEKWEMKIDATELNKHLYFCNEIQLINYFHIRCNACAVLMNI